MKTKRKLRKWVKVALAIIILIVASLLIKNDLETKKKVNNCVKNGYSENYCLAQLGID